MSQQSGKDQLILEVDLSEECVERTGVVNFCHAASKRRTAVASRHDKALQIRNYPSDTDGFGPPTEFALPALHVCDAALMDGAETGLLLLNIAENCLYQVDMECGSVVQIFTPSEALPIQAVTYAAHVANTSPVYTCLTEKALLTVDLRAKRTQTNCQISVKKPLTCHATSLTGHVAVGDETGLLRLFKGPTELRGATASQGKEDAKAPIVDVDLTADGEWVVVVCAKYLLLRRFHENEMSYTGGWRMPWSKSRALKLQPSLAQLVALGGVKRLNFTSGGFDRFGGEKEVCITACSGNYIFTWSLDAVLKAEGEDSIPNPEGARTARRVTALSTMVPHRITYLTHRDVRMAPLKWTLPV